MTDEQALTLARLMRGGPDAQPLDGTDRVDIPITPFDLPAGYVMTTIRGITYGIAPDGDASS